MTLIAYFREKAAQCRRLAGYILGDPAAEALLRLADEFDAKAALYEAQRRRARLEERAQTRRTHQSANSSKTPPPRCLGQPMGNLAIHY
jgi:hypothetical protein